MQPVKVKDFFIGKDKLTIISGPCVIEGEKEAMECAEFLTRFFENKDVNFIFKASYDKANRSSIHSFRGPGVEVGLKILEKIKDTYNIPVFTDVHSPEEAIEAAEVCDVLQIPAFLCRQTDLVVAVGKTKAVVNVKKGQFLAPWDMKNVVEKIENTGNTNILLTERGTSFGYNNLVTDMRSIGILRKMNYPVFFDATHSVQLPGGLGNMSGGTREFIPLLARAAIAAGADGIYAETHPDPKMAKSDSATMIAFSELPQLFEEWLSIYNAIQVCSKSS